MSKRLSVPPRCSTFAEGSQSQLGVKGRRVEQQSGASLYKTSVEPYLEFVRHHRGRRTIPQLENGLGRFCGWCRHALNLVLPHSLCSGTVSSIRHTLGNTGFSGDAAPAPNPPNASDVGSHDNRLTRSSLCLKRGVPRAHQMRKNQFGCRAAPLESILFPIWLHMTHGGHRKSLAAPTGGARISSVRDGAPRSSELA